MKTAITYITENGAAIAGRLREHLPDSQIYNLSGKGKIRNWVKGNFHDFEGHVFIMSMGIVYRIIAGEISDKYHDPAVVVVDDAGRFSIAALSGHEGGANKLAFKTAQILDSQPVITTASDTNKRMILGIGCRKSTKTEEILNAVSLALEENSLAAEDIRIAVSADIKRTEQGLIKAFDHLGIPLLFIASEEIRNFSGFKTPSQAAMRQFNIPGVSEPCALLGGRKTVLIMDRTIYGAVTIALAEEDRYEG